MRNILIAVIIVLSLQNINGQTTIINSDDLYLPRMQDSLPDGNYIYVYKNLNFSFLTGEYKMNKPDGVWQYFTKDSIIKNTIVFNLGVPVMFMDYSEGCVFEEKIFRYKEVKEKIKYWCPTIPDYTLEKPIFLCPEDPNCAITSNNFMPENKLVISYMKGKMVSVDQ